MTRHVTPRRGMAPRLVSRFRAVVLHRVASLPQAR